MTAATGAACWIIFICCEFVGDAHAKRPVSGGASLDVEEGRSRSSAGGSAEGRHLEIGRLAADGLAGIFDLTLVGLPAFADDVLVGGDRTLGCHAQRVRLKAHVGGEFALALGVAVEADRTVEILVAGVVGELGRGVSRASVTAWV